MWHISEDSIKKEKTIKTNQGIISSLSFSYDGQKIATGGGFGSIKIWDVATKKEEIKLPKQDTAGGKIRSISFSRNGNYLVAGGSNKKAYLWDLKNLNLNKRPIELNVANPRQEVTYIYSVSFSPNNQIFATAAGNGLVNLWNIEGKLIKKNSYNKQVFDVSFNQSGTKIAVVLQGGSVEILDLEKIQNREKDKLIKRSQFSIYDKQSTGSSDQNPFYSIRFDASDSLIIIAEDRKNLQYLEYLPGEDRPIKKVKLNGYDRSSSKEIKSAFFNKKINKLITTGNEKIARLWNLDSEKKTKKYFQTHQNSIERIALRPNSNTQPKAEIATLSDGTVKLWSDAGTPIPLTHAKQLEKIDGKIASISFTPDGEQLATAAKDGLILFWNLKGINDGRLDTEQKEITSISFSPDRKYLAVADTKETIKIWQEYLDSNPKGKTIARNQGNISFMSFSPNSEKLVTLGKDTDLPLLWDLSQLEKTPSIKPIEFKAQINGEISDISFSPDGENIVIAQEKNNKLKLFRITSSVVKEYKQFDVKQSGVVGISFNNSSERPRLATAGTDRTIKIWDWSKKEKELITEFESDLEQITSISFSEDGTYVVVGGDQGEIEVWSVQNLEELLEAGCNWLKDYHSSSNNLESTAAELCSHKTGKRA
ncbi:MAG: hypothetical protein QNJ54_22405 [Prochloraceae cyanobacterium]|nr:hypothetical protein [Prochloraceae cyanobacterium]